MYSSWLSTILCLNGVMRNQVTLDCITMLPGSCTLSEGHRAAAGSTASCLLSASKEKVLKYLCFHLWEWLWAPEPLGFVVSLHDPGELSSNELLPSMPTVWLPHSWAPDSLFSKGKFLPFLLVHRISLGLACWTCYEIKTAGFWKELWVEVQYWTSLAINTVPKPLKGWKQYFFLPFQDCLDL